MTINYLSLSNNFFDSFNVENDLKIDRQNAWTTRYFDGEKKIIHAISASAEFVFVRLYLYKFI